MTDSDAAVEDILKAAGMAGDGDGDAEPAPNLPEAFWVERPVFGLIRQAAHSRILSADAFLHAVLVRVAACTPYTVELPPIVGAPAPLNWFAALVGPSGAGKSAVMRTSGEAIPTPLGLDLADLPLGTGEGIAEHYMGTVEVDGKQERQQIRFHALIRADEGEALTRLAERQGATLGETLRRGWTGDLLGQANASAENRRIIPAGRYRLGMMIGLQPNLAGWLLGDAAGGTPQRFVWAAASDPSVTATPPQWPEGLKWAPPDDDQLGAIRTSEGRHHFKVDEEIKAEIIGARVACVQRGEETNSLDGHAQLAKLKLGALVALLDKRVSITPADWQLAGTLWDTSCAVRTWVRQICADDEDEAEAHRVAKHARRERAGAAARNGAMAQVVRVARLLATHVHADGAVRPADLRHRLASRDRDLFEDALTHAQAQEWITESEEGWAAGPQKPSK